MPVNLTKLSILTEENITAYIKDICLFCKATCVEH